MNYNAFPIAVGLSLLFAMGCGQTQDDIRKYAIRRPKDDDDSPSQATPPTTPAVNLAAQPQTVPPPAAPNASALPAAPPTGSPANATTATLPSPVATGGPLSDTVPAGTTWSPREQRGRAIENLKRVAAALQQYQNEKGIFPAPAITSADGRPLLSWRVELLPYLGYGGLAAAFHRDEPWDSPHNQSLLAQIPSVYQSPERLDQRTNLLVPVGTSSAFYGNQGRSPRRWEDGLSNIILLLEVDNEQAVPWTAPQDWNYEPTQPLRGLGNLRGDGFFAAWADTQVALLAKDLSIDTARAMFTVDGGEAFTAASISRAATADPPIATNQVASSSVSATRASQASSSPEFSTSSQAPSGLNGQLSTASPTHSLAPQAIEAAQAGATHDAMALSMAAFLVDPSVAPSFRFRWVPGLKRPALALRYAIGVTYSGSRADQLTTQLTPAGDSDATSIGAYETLLGDLGTTVLSQVREQESFLPTMLNVGDPKKSPTGKASISPVGMGQPGELRQAALRDALDVLLHFEVEERRSSRGGTEATTVSLNVIDVWTGQVLMKSSRINYLKRDRSRTEPLFADPVEEAAREMDELLVKRLRPRDIPTELRATHAEKRVTQLTKVRREYPLPVLCEIKFYRDANLISASQALAAFQSLLGPSPGTELLVGTIEERQEALRPWLPRMKSYVASVRSSSNDSEDD